MLENFLATEKPFLTTVVMFFLNETITVAVTSLFHYELSGVAQCSIPGLLLYNIVK
jgi:hypothetical protein